MAAGVAILAISFAITKGSSGGGNPAPTAVPATTPTTSAKPAPKRAPKPSPARPKRPATPAAGIPSAVARALDRRDVVVLFFFSPGVADDDATRAAVSAARSAAGPRVAVFKDTIDHLAGYRRVVTGVGISETPALVVVNRKRQAQLYEGYLDADSIRQAIRDAE